MHPSWVCSAIINQWSTLLSCFPIVLDFECFQIDPITVWIWFSEQCVRLYPLIHYVHVNCLLLHSGKPHHLTTLYLLCICFHVINTSHTVDRCLCRTVTLMLAEVQSCLLKQFDHVCAVLWPPLSSVTLLPPLCNNLTGKIQPDFTLISARLWSWLFIQIADAFLTCFLSLF